MEGSVVSIAIASKPGSPVSLIAAALLVPNKGIEGDRFYVPHVREATTDDTCDVTFVEQKSMTPESSSEDTARRNIVVQSCRLQQFVGHTFHVGEMLLQDLPPHTECLSEDVLQHTCCMAHLSTSLRARILTDGAMLCVGVSLFRTQGVSSRR